MRGRTLFVTLVLTAVLVGCAQATATPAATETVAVTEASKSESTATEVVAPTETSEPTEVPPTATSEPTTTPVEPTSTPEPTEALEPFAIASSAFEQEAAIPELFSCDGENISPELVWTEPPAGTQSFALICDDPDAPGGTWVHWVVYNVSADVCGLPEAVTDDAALSGGVHGENSWGRTDYGGPCPPSGTHRYYFKLYALDTVLGLEPGATKAQLLDAMDSHVLDEVELMGTYAR